jgi:hypothetical protein
MDAPARSIARSLRMLLMVNHATDGLHVTLRLHIATHNTKAHLWLALMHKEGWNDGMKRALVRTHFIGVTLLKAKAAATILQR